MFAVEAFRPCLVGVPRPGGIKKGWIRKTLPQPKSPLGVISAFRCHRPVSRRKVPRFKSRRCNIPSLPFPSSTSSSSYVFFLNLATGSPMGTSTKRFMKELLPMLAHRQVHPLMYHHEYHHECQHEYQHECQHECQPVYHHEYQQ